MLPAQQGTLAGPIAGFVFDNSGRALRPIQGVPGASLLGDPISFSFDLAAVYVSPRQDSAFVVGTDQSLHFFHLTGGTAAEVSLGGLSGVPQTVVFSPSGSAATLLGPGKARILTGLPSAPTLVATVNVPGDGQASGAPTAGRKIAPAAAPSLALSDDGAYLLTVAGGSARLLGNQGENRVLIPVQPGALVAFAAGGHDAAVMDSLSGLTLIRDASGAAGQQLLASPDDSLAGAAGLAFSQDKLTLYVASATAQSVAAFNLAAGSRSAIACACTPSTLTPMGNVFRLNDFSAAPLWILDTGNSTPRTVFVPARGE
jgi:hypothetical protein